MVKTNFSCQMLEVRGYCSLFREMNKVVCKQAMSTDDFKLSKLKINCSRSSQPCQVGLFFPFPSHFHSAVWLGVIEMTLQKLGNTLLQVCY